MTPDDLRQTLATMAKEVEPLDEPSRLEAVDRLVARSHRRRVGAGVVGAAAVAVLALVVPNVVAGDDGPNPADRTTTTRTVSVLPTVEERGIRFYTSPAGDTLLGETMGQAGARSITLRVVPTTTDLSYRSVCWRPGQAPSGRLAYDVTINGKSVKSASCDGRPDGPLGPDSTFGAASPRANAANWRDYLGAVPGEPMTLRVSLKPWVERGVVSSRLGIALYANTGPRVRDHGVWFSGQVVVDGHTYTLVRRGFSQVSGVHGHMALDLPPSATPLYLVHGTARAHSGYDVTGDGSGFHSDPGGTSAAGDLARAGQRRASLSIRIHGKPGALIYILAYAQVA